VTRPEPDLRERLPDLAADARRLARLTLEEDGPADLTTAIVGPVPHPGTGTIEFRGRGVLAGQVYADAVARELDCEVTWEAREGEQVTARAIGRIRGDRAGLLRVERPLLNLLQRASGIASRTRQYVELLGDTPCRLLHTRKTAPGLRLFDVAAVVAGGGAVHRLDLAHTVMIKDNHWRLLAQARRSLDAALRQARERGALSCQVEVESEAQVRLACTAGADRLLIDNQRPAMVRAWSQLARTLRSDIAIEATGGITLENVRDFALAGADYVSVGGITHSPPAADIALELD
jgi:nicotinate-nucleotide pyrophosphorylase (carboxylating)